MTWIFGSWDGKSFLDNSKYLFLFVNHYFPQINAVWISKDKSLVEELRKRGYKAFYDRELRAIYYYLRAGYYIIDHVPLYGGLTSPLNLWLSGGAKIIQLWHGIPFKRIDRIPQVRRKVTVLKKILSWFSVVNLVNSRINMYVVAPSEFIGKILTSAFRVPEKHLILADYPRNYFYMLPVEIRTLNLDLYNKVKTLKESGKKIIFYIPTFRDTGGNPFTKGVIDVKKLIEVLKNNDAIMIVKFHKADIENVDARSFECEQIIFLKDDDIYELLQFCDILITDYSSIFYDFLFLDRPIVFFPYDLKKYTTIDRELYFDYHSFVPGPICHTFEELLDCLEKYLRKNSQNDFCYKRAKLRFLVFGKEARSPMMLVKKILNICASKRKINKK